MVFLSFFFNLKTFCRKDKTALLMSSGLKILEITEQGDLKDGRHKW